MNCCFFSEEKINCINCYCRGYLPYGRGRIVTKSKPICNFQSIDLTMPGMVVKITGRAFVAGGKPIKVCSMSIFEAIIFIYEVLSHIFF